MHHQVQEVRNAMSELGLTDPKAVEHMELLIKTADADGSGEVNRQEFVNMIASLSQSSETETIFDNVAQEMMRENKKLADKKVIGDDESNLCHPRSPFSYQWDALIGLLLVITVWSMPLSMAFDEVRRDLLVFNIITDFVFLADVVKHLNTGYVDDNEVVIMDRKRVTLHYAQTWLLPDFISSIPVDLVTGSHRHSSVRATKTLKLLRLVRVTKIFRVLRVATLGSYVDAAINNIEKNYRIQIPEGAIAMGRLGLGLLILCHWVGLMEFMICSTYDFPEDSWVVNADLVDASTQMRCTFPARLARCELNV